MNLALPPYTMRYSKKAKYLQIRIVNCSLEIVIPNKKRVTSQDIITFIQKKQAWINRNITLIQDPTLPTDISLPAIQQAWQVKYLATEHPGITLLTNPSQQLTLIGNTTNIPLCFKKLREWLRQLAGHHLPLTLQQLSQETGLTFQRLQIRHNTTRWGSCSSKQHINLCCKLLFLPPALVRHILLHELCHTRIMRHNKAFWQLLDSLDNLTTLHRKQIHTVTRQLPSWTL
ncbi:MAG: hypothetical protein A3E83_09045 [Gammaproteobacteria bacterium RIFCSPHIGHO2_12_FULL_41_20]|nr:MAG: hypothetical protein A3E83_09045 [Gammaproteobacteria bacterium RIFCSPHIGHO2_12_FULL_41_20]